jgi:protein TonB
MRAARLALSGCLVDGNERPMPGRHRLAADNAAKVIALRPHPVTARQDVVTAGERSVPPLPRQKGALIVLLLSSSLVLHGGLIAAFNNSARPLASAGIPAISVEIVLGGRTAAGLASMPSEEAATELKPTSLAPAAVTETASERSVPPAVAEVSPALPDEIAAVQVPAVNVARAVRATPSAAGGMGYGGSVADANYFGRVAAHLSRHKRFPPDARRRGEHGSTEIDFSVDDGGRVTTVRIVRSSGFRRLDEAAVAMVWGASPFPAPPDRRMQRFTVPINYSIR